MASTESSSVDSVQLPSSLPTMASVVLLVVDGLGVGPAPDSALYGDEGADTGELLTSMGARTPWAPGAGVSLIPTHSGKGTTTGHWELFGASPTELEPIHGPFPDSLAQAIRSVVGHDPLWCNYHRSGIELLNIVGEASLRDGRVVAYTSDDAVLQLAAHTASIAPSTLNEWASEIALALPRVAPLGRVITRPFRSDGEGFVRLRRDRRDFHARPLGRTVLEDLIDAGIAVTVAGKAVDIFHWLGAATFAPGPFAMDDITALLAECSSRRSHLLVLNLPEVDDNLHDLELEAAARRLSEVTDAVDRVVPALGDHAALILTGDHGCDIRINATANTRERVPFYVAGRGLPFDRVCASQTMSDVAVLLRAVFLGARP